MLLVLGGAHPLAFGVLLAHVGAFLGVAVIVVPLEVIDLRVEIGPYHRAARAVALGLRLSGILVGAAGLAGGRCRCCRLLRRHWFRSFVLFGRGGPCGRRRRRSLFFLGRRCWRRH